MCLFYFPEGSSQRLEILYQARTKRVDELNHELKTLQDKSATDIRILKHQLDRKEGEFKVFL